MKLLLQSIKNKNDGLLLFKDNILHVMFCPILLNNFSVGNILKKKPAFRLSQYNRLQVIIRTY